MNHYADEYYDDEYYDMDDTDDTPSPEEAALRTAGLAFDKAHDILVSTLGDLSKVLQIHYNHCFRETITTFADTAITLSRVVRAFDDAYDTYKLTAANYRSAVKEKGDAE